MSAAVAGPTSFRPTPSYNQATGRDPSACPRSVVAVDKLGSGGETPDQDRHERVEKFVRRGAQVVGGTAGAAIGLIGTPVAALAGGAAGAALGEMLADAGIELYQRILGPRQAARAAGALAVATVRIDERLREGYEPRPEFVDPENPGHQDAQEILEGTLLTAANAHEQRKVEFLGNFYANLAFTPEVSPGYANLLLKLADRLTFGQLQVIAVLGNPELENELIQLGAERNEGAFRSAPAVVAEMDELGAAGILGVRQQDMSVVRPSNVLGSGSFDSIDLHRARLTDLGRTLHSLLGLSEMPEADQHAVLRALRGQD